MWLVILITACSMKLSCHLSAGQHFSTDDTCVDIVRSGLSDPSSKTRGRPVLMAAPSMYTPTRYTLTQNDQFNFPGMQSLKDLSSSAAVVLIANKSAHNISSCTSSWKITRTKTCTVVLSTSVDSSTWTAHHSDSLILTTVPQYPLLHHPFV